MTKVDWATLEGLPLSLVLDKLEEHIDHVRFGVVCKNWQWVAKLNHQNHQFRINVPPMLMILSDRYYRIHTKSKRKKKSMYSILSEKEYLIQLSHPSIIESKMCLGYSHGWLALGDNNNVVTLVNPFKYSVAPITLPPLDSVYKVTFVDKVTLSADPVTSPSDYVVAAIYNCGSLAFKRASQLFWVHVHANELSFTNVVFYKSMLIAEGYGDTIVSFKFNNPPSDDSNDPNFAYYEKMACTPYFFREPYSYGYPYFVKSLTGDIWMVKIYYIDALTRSRKVDIYKLELDAQSGKVEQFKKLESLENNILFLGIGDPISVSAPCFSKLEKDSIYFITDGGKDDCGKDDLKLQIYNAKDGSFRSQSLPISFNQILHLWVLPQFQWD